MLRILFLLLLLCGNCLNTFLLVLQSNALFRFFEASRRQREEEAAASAPPPEPNLPFRYEGQPDYTNVATSSTPSEGLQITDVEPRKKG